MSFVPQFPAGYHDFNPDKHLNFQLNRWYSLGYFDLERTREIGQRVSGLADWQEILVAYAEAALQSGNRLAAAFYFRAAEFFALPGDPAKLELYDRFSQCFYQAVEGESVTRVEIPYQDGFLPALRFRPETSRGVILLHGGLDSFMEEFYSIARYLVEAGYQVVLFEGPGQGAALRKYGLTMTYEWEKPVAAILDDLMLSGITLIGISLGGFLAPRAAAFDNRIRRVVAYDVYIYNHRDGFFQRNLYQLIRLVPGWYNRLVGALMQRDIITNHIVNQWMYVCGAATPFDWAMQLQHYSIADVARYIKQDVLLLAGKDDHLVPLKEYYNYVMSLTNARSLTGRIFTAEEQASNHCQIGNVKLALDYILEWIEQRS